MILQKVELFNFRNCRAAEIQLSPHSNLFVGRNAQGKSNLLEAIYLISHFNSGRARRMRDMVTDGEQAASVKGSAEDGEERFSVKVALSEAGRVVELNGRKVEQASRARGMFKCVLFSPEDIYLVKGEPSRRRAFLDETVELLGAMKARQVNGYRHVLRQRNVVLKNWESYGAALGTVLEPWDEALCRAGAGVVAARVSIVERMSESLGRDYAGVARDGKAASVRYVATFSTGGGSEQELYGEMLAELRARSPEEKKERSTVVGPHRDDVELTLGEQSARYRASQGEQRSLAFCLRVSQLRHITAETGRAPVLLLDDVLSELDEARRKAVFESAAQGGQVVMTATEPFQGLTGEKMFRVEGGVVTVA